MKKLIFFLIIIFAGLSAFGQLDTTNIGTGANTGTGESIRSAFLKVNQAIRQININTDSLMLKLNKLNPVVTGIIKISTTDTVATKADARLYAAGASGTPFDSTYLHYRVDSIVTALNDTIDGGTVYRELADTVNYSFQVGLGLAGDTACFRKAYILASFNSLVSDTIVVDSVNYVAVGTSDVDVQMYFDTNFNDATPTAVCTSSVTVTSTTTGNGTTSFSNAQIPPGKKVWFRLTEATTQPVLLAGTVFYHVINRTF